MKTQLVLKDDGQKAYGPGDTVGGYVDVLNSGTAPTPLTRLKATLRGKVILRSQIQATETPCRTVHRLFEQSHELQLLPVDTKQSKDIHHRRAFFHLKFPSTNVSCTCGSEESCQLPSSLTLTNPRTAATIRVEYSITVTYKRKILCAVPLRRKLKRSVPFRSSHSVSSDPQPLLSSGFLPINKSPSHDLGVCGFYVKDRSWLPEYTPSFKVDVSCPSGSFATTGDRGRSQSTPIKLFLHTPDKLLRDSDVCIHSMVATIRSSVVSTDCPDHPFEKVKQLWSVKGLVRVDKEHFELDTGSWSSLDGSDLVPSGASCFVECKHTLEVVVGISQGSTRVANIQYLSVSMDVFLVDPPPKYVSESAQDTE